MLHVYFVKWLYRSRSHLRDGPDTRKGIQTYTPLVDLRQPFDLVKDIPLDEFHLVREGMTKLMLLRMFDNQQRQAQQVSEVFDGALADMKVLTEMPRRTRGLSYVKEFKG